MSTELLESIKHQAASLTFSEQAELAAFLQAQSRAVPATYAQAESVERQILHERRTAWLKEHWEEYRGVYVALDDDCHVVGQGPTIREADQQARAKGIKNHFLVRIPRENEAYCPGW
jgi:hypothetical protein